tara:strand:- start:1129 stop:1725 length:597 start_codon:yes stop_codon:yes gene_type:complete
MTKQFVSIVEISMLHDTLDEIKSLYSFKIFNFLKTNDFLKEVVNENRDICDSIIISKKNNHQLLSSKKINISSLILFEEKPIKIGQLLDKINILSIKKKYDFQSQLNIKDYNLNLNSRVISRQGNELKLTEREINIILFLKDKEAPQSVINLQNKVWNYSHTLETHTVETHIYRLRKKIKSKFDDDDFIVSLKEGYKI